MNHQPFEIGPGGRSLTIQQSGSFRHLQLHAIGDRRLDLCIADKHLAIPSLVSQNGSNCGWLHGRKQLRRQAWHRSAGRSRLALLYAVAGPAMLKPHP
jgi:hypothetical protein